MKRAPYLDWTLEDEARQCEYQVRISFFVDGYDPGDHYTPPFGGETHIEDVHVLQTRHFDARGEICGVEMGAEARRSDGRAWELIQSDGVLRARISEACVSVISHAT